jgi:hypothetical protein
MAMASWRASLYLGAGVPHVAAAALEVGVVMVTGCTMVCERAAETGWRGGAQFLPRTRQDATTDVLK